MEAVADRARDAGNVASHAAGGWTFDYRTREWVSSGGVTVAGYDCPTCGGKLTDNAVNGAGCRCENAAWWAAYLAYFAEHGHEDAEARWQDAKSVPMRYRGARFDNFAERPGTESAVARCRAWASRYNRTTTDGLLLIGPFGSGKTHLAVASAFGAMERDLVMPHFVSASTLAHDVKAGKDLDMSPVNKAVSTPLLILDDIGQTGRTEFDRELIYRIISERYENQRPILATSNLTESKLADQLGGALVSRLYEMTDMAALTSSDYRKTHRGRA